MFPDPIAAPVPKDTELEPIQGRVKVGRWWA